MKTSMLLRFFLSCIVITFVLGCATKARVKETSDTEDFAVLTDIQPQEDGVSLTASKNFIYTIYAGNDPYKVTVEIPDMRAGNFKDKIALDKAGITDVLPQQIEGPNPLVRIEITLQSPSTVVPFYKDNTLTLVTKHKETAATPSQDSNEKAEEMVASREMADEPEDTVSPSSSTSDTGEGPAEVTPSEETSAEVAGVSQVKATVISGVELRQSPGGLQVLITGDGTMMPNVFPLDKRIVIDIPDVTLHATIPSDIVPPLKGIRAGKHKDKVRLVLDLKEKTAFDVAAVGDAIEISLKSKELSTAKPRAESPQEEAQKETHPVEIAGENEPSPVQEAAPEERFNGKKISLDFQDAEVGPIFRLLADVNNYNLVLDPTVKGKVTIKLMNVPWDQALDIILNQTHLSHRIEGNILWIAPVKVFDEILKERAELKKTEEGSEPLVQKIVRINYAAASEIQAAINNAKLFSPRGSVTIDSRMNTLIIKDTQKSIESIEDLVKVMDVAKPQVMIEAKLVEVSTTYSESLGIRWGGSFSSQTFPNNVGGDFSVNTPTVGAGPAQEIAGGAMNLTIGHANSMNVNLSLSALESIGKSKTLSNPKVLTMDNEAATIQQGTTFYISTVSQAGTQTQQQTATLSLQVTPKITPDGYVQLKVNATDNSLQPGTAGGDAVVNTKSLTTQALVKNGETLVLGGIYRLDDAETSDGVPLLSKIPGLGWLFKTKERIGPNIKELLIFITPTVVEQHI